MYETLMRKDNNEDKWRERETCDKKKKRWTVYAWMGLTKLREGSRHMFGKYEASG